MKTHCKWDWDLDPSCSPRNMSIECLALPPSSWSQPFASHHMSPDCQRSSDLFPVSLSGSGPLRCLCSSMAKPPSSFRRSRGTSKRSPWSVSSEAAGHTGRRILKSGRASERGGWIHGQVKMKHRASLLGAKDATRGSWPYY